MTALLDEPQQIDATHDEEALRLLSMAQNGAASIQPQLDPAGKLAEFLSLYPIDLSGYVAPSRSIDLAAYAKSKRDATEAAGITVNGVAIASDPDSQTRVANAYAGMQVKGASSIRFKATSGFIVLGLDQVKAVGTALFDHTQACFDAEDQVDVGLASSPPTITTTAQIDAIFAAVPSTYPSIPS